MLPVLMYSNMDGSSNSLNNSPGSSFNSFYDERILNSVRSRKKVSELPNCPVCSCTIRQGELDSHLALEVERLQKLSSGSSKRKISSNSPNTSLAVAGSSTSTDVMGEEVNVSGCLGSDVYQRIQSNRLRRLRARRRSTPPPQQGECPVCNMTLPTSRLQRHALRCLKRTGASMDEDVPDTTSSEDESIDVENDGPSSGPGHTGFGAEYQWCGEWRVRASALLEQPRAAPARRASADQALVVDGDEDTELYGPPQYSPSRIHPDAEIQITEDNQTDEHTDNNEYTDAEQSTKNSSNGTENNTNETILKCNGMVEASAETRIQALKARIKEIETKQNAGLVSKCLICLGPHVSPAVSIQCWHVYCEVCWLQSLRAKKICPQCNAITTTQHLRRIYM
ncbi:E3 ubiquitin-protein ligase RNF220 [Amyelois transitella]|uniref:E3 ubiquitin-protein ligase RNF220 n=1 Tax=Amyelois transitella TaxID=680683 RepID=UPI0029901C32|nr:E3 ubiquitin-protein ligase RNF220 [Amyelois transitella]